MVIKRAFILLVFVVFSNAAPVDKFKHYGHHHHISRWTSTAGHRPYVGTSNHQDTEPPASFVDGPTNHLDIFSVDPELGEHFEGDILLSPYQKLAIETDTDLSERNGLISSTKRWPNRTVVYHIVQDDFDEEQLQMIKDAMNDIANKSCIKFRPKEKDEHAVTIQGSECGCFSSVGLQNEGHKEGDEEPQLLNLSSNCFKKYGTIVHEILHTLGFYHMQSTYDRDEFVKIVWENIEPGKEHNFKKYTVNTVTDFGVSYDYGSVMHYPEKAFSNNGNKTIIPLQENVEIGQREGMSESDVIKLNRMYCEESGEPISYITDTLKEK